jgi:hypothetical protein
MRNRDRHTRRNPAPRQLQGQAVTILLLRVRPFSDCKALPGMRAPRERPGAYRFPCQAAAIHPLVRRGGRMALDCTRLAPCFPELSPLSETGSKASNPAIEPTGAALNAIVSSFAHSTSWRLAVAHARSMWFPPRDSSSSPYKGFTEGNRVLPTPRFPSRVAITSDDIGYWIGLRCGTERHRRT